jgi:hypothetical protein
MLIFRRVEFKNARVGCCGLTRYDSITPVGGRADFEIFKKEALKIMEAYGHQSYRDDGDEYSIEYFEGKSTDQNFREDGKSFLKFVLEKGKWKFYAEGKLQFSVGKIEELKKIWRL